MSLKTTIKFVSFGVNVLNHLKCITRVLVHSYRRLVMIALLDLKNALLLNEGNDRITKAWDELKIKLEEADKNFA